MTNRGIGVGLGPQLAVLLGRWPVESQQVEPPQDNNPRGVRVAVLPGRRSCGLAGCRVGDAE